MGKRKAFCATNGFCTFLHISRVFEICIEFLLPRTKYAQYYDNPNRRFFLKLCSVCKAMKTVMISIHKQFLYPTVLSENSRSHWYAFMPSLTNLCVQDAKFALGFDQLEDLSVETANQLYSSDLISLAIINSFFFPRLRVLHLMYALENSVLPMIAATCPHLDDLNVMIQRQSDDVIICNFNHLRRINVLISNHYTWAHATTIHLSHMPVLTTLTVSCVNFHSLQVGLQVPMLEKVKLQDASLHELVFHEKVVLSYLDLGYSGRFDDTRITLDPFNNVQWNLHFLRIGETVNAIPNLSDLRVFEYFTNYDSNDNANIPWATMGLLEELKLDDINSTTITSIITGSFNFRKVTKLTMSGNSTVTMFDFEVLSKFPNLQELHLKLYKTDYKHVDALLNLKSLLPSSFIEMRVKSEDEEKLEMLRTIIRRWS